jgi:hypothetical protein
MSTAEAIHNRILRLKEMLQPTTKRPQMFDYQGRTKDYFKAMTRWELERSHRKNRLRVIACLEVAYAEMLFDETCKRIDKMA